MQQLKDLAKFAADNTIRGTTFKRNALLKPFDIILEELERCPDPTNDEELELVKAGTQGLIFDHLERIAKSDFKPGRTKQGKVYQYVDMFFDGVLAQAHHRKVNKLLGREKLLRSAYLVYLRQALAENWAARGKTADPAAALDQMSEDALPQADDE